MAEKKKKVDLKKRRMKLRMSLMSLWEDYRIANHVVAKEAGIDETVLSHMLAGRRDTALAKAFDDIEATIKRLSDESAMKAKSTS